MRVIAHRTLVEFYSNRPDSKTAIENWYTKILLQDGNLLLTLKRISIVLIAWEINTTFSI